MAGHEDYEVFEATTPGIVESKGSSHHPRHHPRMSSDASMTSNAPLHVKQARAARAKYADDSVDSQQIPPMVAFEVFAGKHFTTVGDTTSTDLSDSVHKSDAHTMAKEAARRRVRNSVESPIERYHRLKYEVDALAEDVRAMNETDGATTNEGVGSSGSNISDTSTVITAPWKEMARGLSAMQQQLSDIADTRSMKSAGLSMPSEASMHKVLSSRLLSEVERMASGGTNVENDSPAASAATGVPTVSGSDSGGSTTTTYEVLLDSSSRDAVSISRLASLEARFHRVEKALGDTGITRGSGGSGGIVGVLHDLEERVRLLDSPTLDSVGRRVAALSSELEKAVKLRKRLAKNGGTSEEDPTGVRAARVDELYGLVESLGALEKELPMVVARLETLQVLHGETATFSGRLTSLEESVRHVSAETKKQQECVVVMEKSVSENVEMMSKNMKVLDERLIRKAAAP